MCLMPVTVLSADLTLAWDPNTEPDIDGYKVYWGTSSGNYAYVVDIGLQTTCTVSNLVAGTTYYLAVTAYDSNGNESGFSQELRVNVVADGTDVDQDGISDQDEVSVYGTDPNRADTDGDGINDGEELTYWGINWNGDYDRDGTINLLDSDSDNDGIPDGTEIGNGTDPAVPQGSPQPTSLRLSAGEVTLDHNWVRVDFDQAFVDPIVVVSPLSSNGYDPAVVRMRNIGCNGFELRIQEWDYDDGSHASETVGFLVVERGNWTLADGTMIEAGRFDTDQTGAFGLVDFNQSFRRTPVIVSSVSTFNGWDTVCTRVRNVRQHSFEFCMQEQEKNRQSHAVETISYVAWEPSSGTVNGRAFEVGITPDAVTHSFYRIPFSQGYSTAPLVLADMQTGNGMDPANVRYRTKDRGGIELQVDEEYSRDSETTHESEAVGYIIIDAPIQYSQGNGTTPPVVPDTPPTNGGTSPQPWYFRWLFN